MDVGVAVEGVVDGACVGTEDEGESSSIACDEDVADRVDGNGLQIYRATGRSINFFCKHNTTEGEERFSEAFRRQSCSDRGHLFLLAYLLLH